MGSNSCILQCFRAFGKGGAAQNTVFYSVFAPSEKARRPKTVHFTVFSRLRKRRSGPKLCILYCFRACGKGGAVQNTVFYIVFAPSEKAKRPNTLHFILISRLRKRRSGPKRCILQCFRAFGKGGAAKTYAVCNLFAPSEKAVRPKIVFWATLPFPKARKHCKKQCFGPCGFFRRRENTVKYNVFGLLAFSEGAKTL